MNFTTGREKEVGKGPYPNRAALGLGHGLRHSNSKVFFFFTLKKASNFRVILVYYKFYYIGPIN